MMKLTKFAERGQALALIALAAIVLFGFVGLAIDGGAKLSDRRHAQNAADTAALAAALSKVNTLTDAKSNPSISTTPTECSSTSGGPYSDVCTELLLDGLDRAISNGYGSDSTKSTVEIYSPPTSGYYSTVANKDEYVQVIITSHVKTTFMRIFGIEQSDNVVQAVAFAKPGRYLTDGAMIISYDPNPTCPSGPGNGGGSVDVSGSSTLNLYGGGLFINSSIACGYNAPNCPDINITGGAGINSVAVSPIDNIDQKDGFCAYPPVPENYNQAPVSVPEDVDTSYPDVPPECSMSGHPTPTKLGEVIRGTPPKTVEEWLIYPGFYDEFPQPALVANKSDIYMASGVYCIDPPMSQDLSWSPVDAASLHGSTESNPSKSNYNKYYAYNPNGVTLYIRSGGGFTINSNNPTYLDASTTGDYQGYLIILEGTHTSIETCSIGGGADIHIDGLIWAPYCNITVDGQSSPTAEINAQLVGWDIKITGNNTINFNYNPSNQVKIKRKVGLMK
jgi:hypothetical protein